VDITLSQKAKSFSAAAVPLSIVTLIARVITFVTQIVIAHRFGVSMESDAYFASESVLLLLGGMVVIGTGIAFIPLWTKYRQQLGELEASRFATAFISLITILTIVLAILVFLGAPWISRIIAPGFSPMASTMTTKLLRVVALVVPLLGYTAGCTGLLEAHRRFLVPAFSRVVYGLIVLFAVITLSDLYGVMSLAWGAVAASLARLAIQWIKAKNFNGTRLTWRVNHVGARRAVYQILPIIIALLGLQVALMLDKMVASLLPEGALAQLAYSSRVMLLPVGILAIPLRTTILPTLSQQAAQREYEIVGKTALEGLRILASIIVPVSAGLILLRQPLVHLLFERGAFDSQAAYMTASVLGAYAIGIPAIGGLLVIGNAYFSLGDPVSLIKFNLFFWVSNILLNLIFLDPLGQVGIALATSISSIATFCLAVIGLKRRFPGIDIKSLIYGLIKIFIATGVMIIVSLFVKIAFLDGYVSNIPSTTINALVALTFIGIIGVLVYTLAALVLRVDVMESLFRFVLRRLRAYQERP